MNDRLVPFLAGAILVAIFLGLTRLFRSAQNDPKHKRGNDNPYRGGDG